MGFYVCVFCGFVRVSWRGFQCDFVLFWVLSDLLLISRVSHFLDFTCRLVLVGCCAIWVLGVGFGFILLVSLLFGC